MLSHKSSVTKEDLAILQSEVAYGKKDDDT